MGSRGWDLLNTHQKEKRMMEKEHQTLQKKLQLINDPMHLANLQKQIKLESTALKQLKKEKLELERS